jgi:hypothetical protein
MNKGINASNKNDPQQQYLGSACERQAMCRRFSVIPPQCNISVNECKRNVVSLIQFMLKWTML